MTTWISTSFGLINASFVAEVRRLPVDERDKRDPDTWRYKLLGAKGEDYGVVSGVELRAFENLQHTLPALPGYSVIQVCDEPPPHDVFAIPIIGWTLDGICDPGPIPLWGDIDGAYGILLPDGRVAVPNEQVFDSKEAFVADRQREHARQREQRATEQQPA